ncbi:MAG: 6-bladed beta-propeller [Bacteroidales bacterium]|nr:6-bladed beta-propeller [Bacteroidales bacterium]
MKCIHQLLFLVFLSIISCTAEKESEIYEFTIDVNQSPGVAKLSQICDELEYIRIDSDSVLIGSVREINYTDGVYALSDGSKLYLINELGDLYSVLDNKGDGPGEYSRLFSWDTNLDNEEIVVCDDIKDKILYYDTNGTYTNQILITSTYSILRFYNDSLLFLYDAPWSGTNELSIRIINTVGDTVWSYKNKFKFEAEAWVMYGKECVIYQKESNIFFKEMMDDTLYCLDKDYHIEPYAIFNTNDLGFTANKRGDYTHNNQLDAILVLELYETVNHFILLYVYKGIKFWIADKNSMHSITLEKDGFVNDVDGGMPFNPAYQIEDKYLLQVVDAYKFNAWLESDDFKNFDSDLEAKEKFRKLAESLGENDNPVIIKCKLK